MKRSSFAISLKSEAPVPAPIVSRAVSTTFPLPVLQDTSECWSKYYSEPIDVSLDILTTYITYPKLPKYKTYIMPQSYTNGLRCHWNLQYLSFFQLKAVENLLRIFTPSILVTESSLADGCFHSLWKPMKRFRKKNLVNKNKAC